MMCYICNGTGKIKNNVGVGYIGRLGNIDMRQCKKEKIF